MPRSTTNPSIGKITHTIAAMATNRDAPFSPFLCCRICTMCLLEEITRVNTVARQASNAQVRRLEIRLHHVGYLAITESWGRPVLHLPKALQVGLGAATDPGAGVSNVILHNSRGVHDGRWSDPQTDGS